MELDVGLQAVPGQHHAGLQNLSRFLDEELNLSASAANSLIQEAARQIVVAQYCEATEFGWPEWGSILTAPVIGLCGLHMLMFWATRHAYMLKLLAALFVANSLGSFYMHFGGRQGWQRVDGETMILAVWIVNACTFNKFAEELLSRQLRRYVSRTEQHAEPRSRRPSGKAPDVSFDDSADGDGRRSSGENASTGPAGGAALAKSRSSLRAEGQERLSAMRRAADHRKRWIHRWKVLHNVSVASVWVGSVSVVYWLNSTALALPFSHFEIATQHPSLGLLLFALPVRLCEGRSRVSSPLPCCTCRAALAVLHLPCCSACGCAMPAQCLELRRLSLSSADAFRRLLTLADATRACGPSY